MSRNKMTRGKLPGYSKMIMLPAPLTHPQQPLTKRTAGIKTTVSKQNTRRKKPVTRTPRRRRQWKRLWRRYTMMFNILPVSVLPDSWSKHCMDESLIQRLLDGFSHKELSLCTSNAAAVCPPIVVIGQALPDINSRLIWMTCSSLASTTRVTNTFSLS